jgi:hypothetical protein
MGATIKTSKIFLAVALISGLILLFLNKLSDIPAAVCYGIILSVCLWNRINSRNSPSSMRIKGPGGLELNIVKGEMMGQEKTDDSKKSTNRGLISPWRPLKRLTPHDSTPD